jgi:hypothetical protein
MVAQLVEKLRHKPEDHSLIRNGFTGIFHWLNPSGHTTASNRTEQQEYFLGDKGGQYVGLMTLPPPYADCLEILETSTSESPKGLPRPVIG